MKPTDAEIKEAIKKIAIHHRVMSMLGGGNCSKELQTLIDFAQEHLDKVDVKYGVWVCDKCGKGRPSGTCPECYPKPEPKKMTVNHLGAFIFEYLNTKGWNIMPAPDSERLFKNFIEALHKEIYGGEK